MVILLFCGENLLILLKLTKFCSQREIVRGILVKVNAYKSREKHFVCQQGHSRVLMCIELNATRTKYS